MHMETGLDRIRELAEEREDDNWAFRSFLKFHNDGLDDRVHRILAEVKPHIDCAACRNCCKVLQPTLSDGEIETLAQVLSMPPEAFQEEYVEKSTLGDAFLRGLPCRLLKDNRCTVEAHRPEDCREFPYLHRDEFVTRLMGVCGNYAVCPIVFNVYEQLKRELRWRPRRRRRR